jgi:DNA-directed RNA polymerase specialized sigma24 family protein
MLRSAGLTDPQIKAVVAICIHRLSYRAAARRLKISIGALGGRICRARQDCPAFAAAFPAHGHRTEPGLGADVYD